MYEPNRLRVLLADSLARSHVPGDQRQGRPSVSPVAHPPCPVQPQSFGHASVLEVDTRRHVFQLTLAGFPDPVLWQSIEVSRILPARPLRLAAPTRGSGKTEAPAGQFPTGACLIVVNAGLLNAGALTRGEAFGVSNLLAAIQSARSPSQMAPQIVEAVHRHLGGAAPESDATVVVITRTAANGAVAVNAGRPGLAA